MQPKTEEELADVISRTDLVMARGFTPRKKARFAPEPVEGAKPDTAFATLPETLGSSPDEVLSSLSIVWPTLQRNQQQLVDLVEQMRSRQAQLTKELSNDMDSADVRFDRVERMLGEWPDEFATSQL
eukprot:scaffold193289_cov41-Attheya_sp.AAC.1